MSEINYRKKSRKNSRIEESKPEPSNLDLPEEEGDKVYLKARLAAAGASVPPDTVKGPEPPSPAPTSAKSENNLSIKDKQVLGAAGYILDDRYATVVTADQLQPFEYSIRNAESLAQDPTYPGLKESIRREGVLSHLWVRPLVNTDGNPSVDADSSPLYEVIAGFCRMSGAKAAGDKTPVPVTVFLGLTDDQAIKIQALENDKRQNPSIWDVALNMKRLRDKKEMSTASIGSLYDKDRSTTSTYIGYAEKIPEEVARNIMLRQHGDRTLTALKKAFEGLEDKQKVVMIDRIIESADEIDKDTKTSAEKVSKIFHKALVEMGLEKQSSPAPESRSFQSQKGKALTISRTASSASFKIHKDVFEAVDPKELEDTILEYLKSKGLVVEEKVKS